MKPDVFLQPVLEMLRAPALARNCDSPFATPISSLKL